MEPRRPGWGGVVAVGAGAAVLSSLLTVGAGNAFGSGSSTVVPFGTSSSSQTSPLVSGGSTTANWVAAAAAVEPSVVSVRVQASDGSGDQGSGVILDSAGRVLTNNHVVAAAGGGDSLSVVLSDKRIFSATVVGTDPASDLAVIQLTNPPTGLKSATFADSSSVKVGDAVMAIGNPLGLSDTVTTGIVSALNRPVNTGPPEQQQPQDPSGVTQPQSEQVVTSAIQTDAAINPGNSGGALVDTGGRVIGITSSIASLSSSTTTQAGSIGLGFAIPANEAKDVATQLIANGTVKHAYLGVTLTDGMVDVGAAQRQAAVIGAVTSGGPAAEAGLQAKDAIVAVNGQFIDSADSLVAQVRALHPGTSVTLTIVRGGHQQNIPVTLAVRPADAG
jgi:putative serine protease PepD